MNRAKGHTGRKWADITAFDKESKPVLLVEVKARKGATESGITQLLDLLTHSDFQFGMFADFEKILVFQNGDPDPKFPILELTTADVLSFYEPKIFEKRIFHEYFETLIAGWLRDFVFHWKFEHPPFTERMESVGLAQLLAGGATFTKGERFW